MTTSQPAEQPAPPLGGLAALVTVEDVRQHLLGRSPQLLDDPTQAGVLNSVLRGIAAEVQAITGPDPADPDVRALALWCISLGAAARIETSLFPEQQYGDQGRAQLLTASYLGVRAQLSAKVGVSATAPLSHFDPPRLTWDRPRGRYGLGGSW